MILVLGASGTVGKEVVRQLTAAKADFKAAYRDPSKAPADVKAVKADFTDPASIDAALQGASTLFLLSPSNAADEIAVVNAAKNAGVKHVVKLSVWGAEDAAFSFAKVHHQVEEAIEQSGMKWTFLRPNGFMQNLANFSAPAIRTQGVFYGGIGDARVSHVDVRDIAAVAVAALTKPGHENHAYSLSGPEGLTYAEIATKISKAIGKDVHYVDLPPDQLKGGMTSAGIPEPYADALLDLNRHYRGGHAASVSGDVKQVTCREPIAFDQYVKDNADAFRA